MSPRFDSDPQLTHVSLIAEDVDESTEFYETVLGCEPVDTPHLGKQEDFVAEDDIQLQMLRIGNVQLHLWNDPAQPIESIKFAHFGIHVDDFMRVYRIAEERDIFATVGESSAPPRIFDFNGTAQMYIHDPTGNLVEVDYPDISELDRSEFAEVVTREVSGPVRHTYSDIGGEL
jgi:catechol 2,3-dioxygenase-like lactoylglutathione lyase family enzyme